MMLRLRVLSSRFVARDVRLFSFISSEGSALPSFTAGAHLKLQTPSGAWRKYSLTGVSDNTLSYEIAVKREASGNGGSISMVDTLQDGDLIDAYAPENAFPLVESSGGYLFVAGGIGITPIRAMIHQVQKHAKNWRLIYLTRDSQDTAFFDEFHGARNVTLHHDGGDIGRAYDLWPSLETPTNAHIYCCGPRVLMQSVRDMSGHWSQSRVHFESFADGSVARANDVAFQVKLQKSNRFVQVPIGASLLTTLRGAGCEIPSSCESGSCGTCKTSLLSGDVDHRDFVLFEEDHSRYILPCVSRGRGGVVTLDL